MRSIFFFFLMLIAGLSSPSFGDACRGSINCDQGIATCYQAIPLGGSCEVLFSATHVVCVVKNMHGQVISSESDYCEEDPDIGLGDLPILDPEQCDISDPLYWLYCTGFPVF